MTTAIVHLTDTNGHQHRQHLEPGEVKALVPGLNAHHLDDELLIHCGNLSDPVERVEHQHLYASKDGDIVAHDYGAGTIPFCTGLPHRLSPLKINPPTAVLPFLEAYMAGGPPMSRAPDWILDHLDDWGPDPDGNATPGTGSGRLRLRVPGAVAALICMYWGAKPGGEKYIQAAEERALPAAWRWAVRQWRRGSHVGEDVGGVTAWEGLPVPPVWFRHDERHEYILHQGYDPSGNKGGGFSDLYSSPRPPGVTWSKSGDPVCDPKHMAVDQSALLAALTGSKCAAIDALCTVEAGMSLWRHDYDATGRQDGHMLRALGVTYPVCKALGFDVEHFKTVYLPMILTQMESRNTPTERGLWPSLDRGHGDGGHLEGHHLDYSPAREVIEWAGWTLDEAAKSGNVWQSGIRAHGAGMALKGFGLI